MKVDILTPIRYGGPQKWGDDLVRALKNEGIEARNIHNFWGIILRFFYTDADVVHSALPLFFNLQDKPIILTVHGDYTREKNIWKYLWPIAIKKAKRTTVPSEFLKKEIGLEQAFVIPNCIFSEDFKPSFNKNKKDKVIQITTVTGFKFLDKSKGVLELIRILERVKKKTKKQFTFTVVGGGVYLKKIEEEAKKYGLLVHFIGFHPSPSEILQRSDIFVYYSNLDNFPFVILEAMASGLPVITNDIGAVSEIIETGKDGYITDKDSMVNILNKLIDDIQLRKLIGRRAKLSVGMKFDLRKMICLYYQLYKCSET